ncbi:MAG: hypothetical protein KAW09_02455 [Thermoplasmata archaeon]|nr:hypothetical protein [Thermoplasmata archaeon]
MRDPKLARKAIHFLVPLIILQSILVGFLHNPVSGQEPDVVDIGGWTRKATWALDDQVYYTSENVTFQGGGANLTLNDFWWSESNQSGFSDGSWDDYVTITPDGNLTLKDDDTNLVSNGDFGTDSDWAFLNGSGNNVISERDGA